jgi:predicted DNA-binding WGR domain protein
MHHPEFDLWRHQRWENPVSRRYYEAWLLKNLFGDWEIVCRWGGIGANSGNSKVYPANSRDVALELFQTIHKRRLKRQYCPVNS